MRFRCGDIVRLKSGGKKMRVRKVLAIGDTGGVCVVAYNNEAKHIVEERFNAACLELVRAK